MWQYTIKQHQMDRAFFAFEFWKNAGADKEYWMQEYVERRSVAIGRNNRGFIIYNLTGERMKKRSGKVRRRLDYGRSVR